MACAPRYVALAPIVAADEHARAGDRSGADGPRSDHRLPTHDTRDRRDDDGARTPTGRPERPPTSDPGFPIPGLPLPTRNTDIPEVPAPPNALRWSASEYNDLDEATRLAVVREILAQEDNPLGPDGEFVGQMLADAACQFLPSARSARY